MEISFSKLLETYHQYIINNEIIDDEIYNLNMTVSNIEKFKLFLDNHAEYNNNTLLYYKILYHYYKKEYKEMLELAEGVEGPNIMNLIGCYYKYIEKNYNMMKIYYIKAIENNNSFAMNELGQYYQDIEVNYDLMKKYYLMAVKLNNPNAMNNLGYHYYIVEKNYDLMKEYYMMAIKLNCPAAMNNMGYYYCHIKKNYDLMKEYYMMAIKLNNLEAMHNLGYYYYQIKNYDLMEQYYQMAIKLNNPKAMESLGYYYQIVKNYDLMKQYYLMAIDFKSPGAAYCLGSYYNCVEKNTDMMLKYMKIAVELKHQDAMIFLGDFYKEDTITHFENDHDKMKEYYNMAIELKNTKAMIKMAEFYRYKEIYDEKLSRHNCDDKYYMTYTESYRTYIYDLMKKYYNMAIECGCLDGVYGLASHYGDMRNYRAKLETHMLGVRLNDPSSMVAVGDCYAKYENNIDKMMEYYHMATKLNSPHGYVALGEYYKNDGKNEDLMLHYYNMAIIKFKNEKSLTHERAICHLYAYYKKIKNYPLMFMYCVMGIEYGYSTFKSTLKDDCSVIEGNMYNKNKYIYYPRILTIILCFNRRNIQNINISKEKYFLPAEIYINEIFQPYISRLT